MEKVSTVSHLSLTVTNVLGVWAGLLDQAHSAVPKAALFARRLHAVMRRGNTAADLEAALKQAIAFLQYVSQPCAATPSHAAAQGDTACCGDK